MRPTPGHAYVGPAHPRWTETLRDHRQVLLRPIERQDAQAERDFIEALSPESRRARFLCQMNSPGEALIDSLTDIDYVNDVAFIAVVHDDGRCRQTAPTCHPPGAGRQRQRVGSAGASDEQGTVGLVEGAVDCLDDGERGRSELPTSHPRSEGFGQAAAGSG